MEHRTVHDFTTLRGLEQVMRARTRGMMLDYVFMPSRYLNQTGDTMVSNMTALFTSPAYLALEFVILSSGIEPKEKGRRMGSLTPLALEYEAHGTGFPFELVVLPFDVGRAVHPLWIATERLLAADTTRLSEDEYGQLTRYQEAALIAFFYVFRRGTGVAALQHVLAHQGVTQVIPVDGTLLGGAI